MKHLLALFCCVSLMPSAFAFEATYPTQVPQGSTVEFLVPRQNIAKVEGTLNNKAIAFYEITRVPRDEDRISRGEFVDLVMKSYGGERVRTGTGTLFPDVPVEASYAMAIYQAKDLGFVGGYEDGGFHPEDPLTRAQAAKILMNAFLPPLLLQTPAKFVDLPYTHALATFMNLAIRAKLFQGYGDGTVKPDRYLNFSEAETLLIRAAGKTAVRARLPETLFRGLIGLHRTSDVGQKKLVLKATLLGGGIEEKTDMVQVGANKYEVNVFSIGPGSSAVGSFTNADYNKTWEMIDGAKATTNPQQLWEGVFIKPTNGELSLGYGDRMVINGVDSGTHAGLDYADPTGTPIHAANTGMVILSDWTPFYGHTIVIDHGQNVFTMYLHMSKRIAMQGQMVKKGETIGEVGATGIASGPHLHYNFFIGNISVNPEQWYTQEF